MLLYKLEHKNILKLQGVLRDYTILGMNITGKKNFHFLKFIFK